MSRYPVADTFNTKFQQIQPVGLPPQIPTILPLTPKLESPIVGPSESPSSGDEGSQNGSTTAGAKRAAPDTPDGHSSKPKQKRNKPTLSCVECVERKTKVS